MAEKARRGHVVGCIVFGYDNVPIPGPSGKRSHVERVINESQAQIVRRIFAESAAGTGFTRLAKQLNNEKAPAPKPKRGRAPAWTPSTIRTILTRRLYVGEAIWGRSKKRDKWGQTKPSRRPENDWIRAPAPAIITEPQWRSAHERLDRVRAQLAATGAAIGNRRSRDIESPYLLSGFSRCNVCGSSLGVLGGSRRSARRYVYGCTRYH